MTDNEDVDRRFGAQLNNSVWAELDKAEIDATSPLERREDMLYAAYASAHHWRQVGHSANRARAEHLIARAATATGYPDVALRHAERCLELVESHADEMEDWDLGFALEAKARALAAVGRADDAAAVFSKAKNATAHIEDAEDRSIVEAELVRPPWFGLDSEPG